MLPLQMTDGQEKGGGRHEQVQRAEQSSIKMSQLHVCTRRPKTFGVFLHIRQPVLSLSIRTLQVTDILPTDRRNVFIRKNHSRTHPRCVVVVCHDDEYLPMIVV